MTTSPKNDRLDLRLPAGQKRLIEQAAEWLGQPVSSFVLGVVLPRASEVLRDRDVTTLSERDRDRFLELLDDADAAPNEALIRAAERYRDQIG
jgi:uncharacterized protein (DUF1778 family)